MKEGRNNTILLTVIGIATLLVAVAGATFAYFTAQTNYNDLSSTLYIKAGDSTSLSLEGSYVELKNIYPKADAWDTKVIRFTNTTPEGTVMTNDVNYTLYMKVQNEFSSGALKYTLTRVTGDNKVCLTKYGDASCAADQQVTTTDTNTGNLVPEINTATGITVTGTGEVTFGNGKFVEGTQQKSHVYLLTIYFPETNSNQNADQNKTFTGTVSVKQV